MKKILTVLLSMFLLLTMSGCDFFNGSSSSKVSGDWKDFEFSLNGKVFKRPWYYEDLENDGWEVYWGLGQIDAVISSGADVQFFLKNEKYYDAKHNYYMPLNVAFYNSTDKNQVTRDCEIYSISLHNTFSSSGYDMTHIAYEVEIAKGIRFGSSVEEVISAYGDVESKYFRRDIDNYTELQYYTINNNIITKMDLIFEEDGLRTIAFTWYEVPDNFVYKGPHAPY